MKTCLVMLTMLTLLLTAGCGEPSAPPTVQGGIANNDQQFSISTPATITLKQGERRATQVALTRGSYFKQAVDLTVSVEGITVTPAKLQVKSSDSPTVQLQVEAGMDAAIGAYRVTVRGTPESGAVSTVEFVVNVVAP